MHQFPIVPSYKRWVSNNGRKNTPISRLRWIFIVVTRSLRYSKSPAICENVHQKALDEHWDMKMIHMPFLANVPVPVGSLDEAVTSRYANQSHMGFAAQFLICLPHAKTYGGGLVQLANGQFLSESSWRLNSMLGSKHYKTWFRRNTASLEGDYYNLQTFWGGNYGHWLYEDVPRLLSALPHLPDNVKFLIPRDMGSWKLESLYALGIKEDQLHPIDGHCEAHCERLWFATELGSSREFITSPSVVKKLRMQLLQHAESDLKGDDCEGLPVVERIFISRGNSSNERLTNEDDLIEVAKTLGFEVISPLDYSLLEQINIFKNAKIIVGVFGAALTNIMFAKPNATLVDLQDGSYFACPRVWFWKMAYAFGMRYKTIVGKPDDIKNWGEINFSIDPQFFYESLREICKTMASAEPEAVDFYRPVADLED